MFIPAITAAAISGLGSIIGGIVGANGQNSANQANLQAARETNAQNYKIFHEQLDYNTNMMNAQNAYNTPIAQRQRYEDAGINPYLALGNISSGSQQSSLTAPNAPNMVTPQVQPVTAFGEALSTSIQQGAQVYAMLAQNKADLEYKAAQTQSQKIQNALDQATLLDRIGITKEEHSYKKYLNQFQSYQNYIADNTKDLTIQQAQKQVDIMGVDLQIKQTQRDILDFDLNFKKANDQVLFNAQLAKVYAETFGIYSNARASMMNAITNAKTADAQIKYYMAQTIKTTEETTGIHLSNIQFSRCMEFVVGKAKADLQLVQANTADVNSRGWFDKNVIGNRKYGSWFEKGFWDLYDSGRHFIQDYSPFRFGSK